MFGIEGFVCVLMLLPIFTLAVWLGYFISKKLKLKSEKNSHKVTISALPLMVLLAAGQLEQAIDLKPKRLK